MPWKIFLCKTISWHSLCERERERESLLLRRLKKLFPRRLKCFLKPRLFFYRNFARLEERLAYVEKRLTAMQQSAAFAPHATGDLRLHQLASVALLKRFTDFLDSHSIAYWLDFGTLLGAVRHQGFIPWDDDVDISMTRRDYERLKAVLPLWHTDEQWYFNFKIFQIYYGNTHLNVDIFPYMQGDTVLPPKGALLKELSLKMGQRLAFSQLKHEPRKDERGREKWDSVPESFDAETVLFFNREILENRPPLENGYLVMPLIGEVEDLRHCIPHNKVFPLQKIKFEGLEFCSPRSPDFILREYYGDYWQFPAKSTGFDTGHNLLPKALSHEEVLELCALAREVPHLKEEDLRLLAAGG